MIKPHLLFCSKEDLAAKQIQAIKALFDDEYLANYGEWNIDNPYGYAPQDYHLLAYLDDDLIGHMGSQVCQIAVGEQKCLIAGIGGVLLAPSFRGKGLGKEMMSRLLEENARFLGVDFSYLGCRKEIVPYYESCGFVQLNRLETFVHRLTGKKQSLLSDTVKVASARKEANEFPEGDIDLRGRVW